jgi:hypothetical protein
MLKNTQFTCLAEEKYVNKSKYSKNNIAFFAEK